MDERGRGGEGRMNEGSASGDKRRGTVEVREESEKTHESWRRRLSGLRLYEVHGYGT